MLLVGFPSQTQVWGRSKHAQYSGATAEKQVVCRIAGRLAKNDLHGNWGKGLLCAKTAWESWRVSVFCFSTFNLDCEWRLISASSL
ncbi:hypothetical protein HUU40_22435 [candidate division KSB1 bacterium]|nr:hypothetical protein [candidate division KSB1 bacterium]